MALDFRKKLSRLIDGGVPMGSSAGIATASPSGSGAEDVVEGSPGAIDDASRDTTRQRRIEQLRSLIGDVVSRRSGRERPAGHDRSAAFDEVVLPGERRETPHGAIQLVEEHLEPHHCHGSVPIVGALDVAPAIVARLALAPELADVDLSRMVILDTETTGLSSGSGTLPFLIGIAWFEDQSLCVQQLFLRRPGEEVPILRHLSERLAWSSCLVTYNGKSFDWPLLRTRYVMNRVPMPVVPAHLDLLHCARRIYRRRLQRVRLVQVEEAVLGMCREYDIDGSEIPTLYLDYLRTGDAAPMARVIEHNANDLVALAAILARMGRHFARVVREDDPRDHLGYALVAERAKDSERARAFAAAAVAGGGDDAITLEALMCAARTARRTRDSASEEEALLAALGLCAAGGRRGPEIHLSLAKLYEHRHKDFARAAEHARHAEAAEGPDASARRMARLERRAPSHAE
jgi:hypothetical protein